jgi:hypothetical protein
MADRTIRHGRSGEKKAMITTAGMARIGAEKVSTGFFAGKRRREDGGVDSSQKRRHERWSWSLPDVVGAIVADMLNGTDQCAWARTERDLATQARRWPRRYTVASARWEAQSDDDDEDDFGDRFFKRELERARGVAVLQLVEVARPLISQADIDHALETSLKHVDAWALPNQ